MKFIENPITHAPQKKEGSFLPGMNDRGILSRPGENNNEDAKIVMETGK